MKVTLVLCPQVNPDKPPLSLAYLSASLISQGINVQCFDFNIELYAKQSEEKKKLWDGTRELVWLNFDQLTETGLINEVIIDGWVSEIEKTGPQIVGFSLLATTFRATVRVAEKLKIKNPNLKIIFGGPEVYRIFGRGSPDIFDYVDACILGEGEAALLKAVLSLKKHGRFVPGEGIAVKEGARFVCGEDQKLILPLDIIPFPNYGLLPLELYKERGQFPLLFSRGCVSRCSFCFEQAYWKRFRQRSVNNVLREIQLIHERYGIDCFSLNDSLINGNMQFLDEFCERIIHQNFQVFWWGMARIDALMTEEFLKKMKRAGCRSLCYGIESGSQRVLNSMHKDYSISLIDEVLVNTWKAGMRQGINLLLGFPGEDEDDFQQTCELVKRHGHHIGYVNVATLGIEPFTDLYKRRDEMGVTIISDTEHWQTLDGKNDLGVRQEKARKLSEIIERYVGKENNFTHES